MYQQPPQQQQQQQNNRRPMMQHGDGGDNVVGMSKCYKPYAFNAPQVTSYTPPPQKNYYDEPQMNSHEYEMALQDHMTAIDEDDMKIEFFQCPPPPKNPPKQGKSTKDPFRPVLESLRQFSDTNTHENEMKPPENNQTYFFSHNGDDAENRDVDTFREENDEEIVSHENSYKSRTKIVSIPNGVRIVTEIVKSGECGNEVFRNFRQFSKTHDKWQNKSKIILGDDDNKQGHDDGNSNENEADDDYEKDFNALINL